MAGTPITTRIITVSSCGFADHYLIDSMLDYHVEK